MKYVEIQNLNVWMEKGLITEQFIIFYWFLNKLIQRKCSGKDRFKSQKREKQNAKIIGSSFSMVLVSLFPCMSICYQHFYFYFRWLFLLLELYHVCIVMSNFHRFCNFIRCRRWKGNEKKWNKNRKAMKTDIICLHLLHQ